MPFDFDFVGAAPGVDGRDGFGVTFGSPDVGVDVGVEVGADEAGCVTWVGAVSDGVGVGDAVGVVDADGVDFGFDEVEAGDAAADAVRLVELLEPSERPAPTAPAAAPAGVA